MEVTSSAFQAGQTIPTKYTCEGADISPPLQWSGVPVSAKGLALICDDPDAPVGTWAKQELLRAMDGHILAEARLSGTYQRKR
jgi:phosphatidylethanolamine-binding protein (PEBP) family uncharacterized protein